MRKMIIAAVVMAAAFGSASTVGGPARVDGIMCDRDPDTSICLTWAPIKMRPEEVGRGLSHPDSLRQLEAFELAMGDGKMRKDTPSGGSGKCNPGDIGCGCMTPFHVVGRLWACDGACTTCILKGSR